MVSYKADPHELEMVEAIANRAFHLIDYPIDRFSLEMDLIVCHKNGCPLKFDELLQTDDLNFVQDVFGISRNLNRETGRLSRNFWPMCAHEPQFSPARQAS